MRKLMYVGLFFSLLTLNACEKEDLTNLFGTNGVNQSPNLVSQTNNDNLDDEVAALLKAAGFHNKANVDITIFHGIFDLSSMDLDNIRCLSGNAVCAIEISSPRGIAGGEKIIIPTHNPKKPEIIRGRTKEPIRDTIIEGINAKIIPIERFEN